MKRYVLDS